MSCPTQFLAQNNQIERALHPAHDSIDRSKQLLSHYNATAELAAEQEALFATATAELEYFALNGDLHDLRAVSAISERSLHARLIARRLEQLRVALAQAEEQLNAQKPPDPQ